MFAPRRRSEGLDPIGWKALDKLRGVTIRGPGARDRPPEPAAAAPVAPAAPAVPPRADFAPNVPTNAPGKALRAEAFAPDWNAPLDRQAADVDPTAAWATPALAAPPSGLGAFRESPLEAVLGAPAPAPTYAPQHVTVAQPAKARIRLGDIWSNSPPTEARLFALELAKVAVVMQHERVPAARTLFALSGLRGMAVALCLAMAGLFAGNAVAVSTGDIQAAAAASDGIDLPPLSAFVSALPLAAIGPFGFGPPDHRVDVCHVAGHRSFTITVDDDAVRAHLAHGDRLGDCDAPGGGGGNGTGPGGNGTGPGGGGGNGTGPGGNGTGPGGNGTGPGGNGTGPGGNGTGPGGNGTGPGGNGTGPGGNGTGGGGGSNPPTDVGGILLGRGGGGGGSAASPGAPAAPAAPAAPGSGSGSGGSGPPPGLDGLLRVSVPMPGSLGGGSPGLSLALGTAMEATSGRRSQREGEPHSENEPDDAVGPDDGDDADGPSA